MATVTVANIIVGPGTLKVDGVDIGAITGGLSVAKQTDVYAVEVDNVRAPVKHIPVKETLTIKTTLSEATLENLRIVWNIATAQLSTNQTDENGHLYNQLVVGMSTGVVEHTLTATGVAPNGKTRVYNTYRAIAVRASEHSYQRQKETLFPVEFDILPDLTRPAGTELGTVTDYSDI